MKKKFINFIIITFLRSVFISMLKFFLRSYLKETNISLEQIAGYISLWGIIAYLVGGSLAYVFRKKNITLFAWLIAMLCLTIGNALGYYPFRVFVTLISVIGFSYGLWLVVKSIILSIEIQSSNHGEAKINGIINIVILLGILLWSYMGFTVFDARWAQGFQVIIAILISSSILTMVLDYDKGFESKKFSSTIKTALPQIIGTVKKYIWLLLPIGALRAISTAIGQKILEIGVDIFQRTTTNAILIIVISFIGAIVGHLVSVFFTKQRRLIAMIFTIVFGLATIYFPHIIDTYEHFITLNIFWFFIGVFFGIAVNLLEGRYFFHIGDDHRKEYWSVAYGIMTSIIIFLIMIAADYIGKVVGIKITFFFFGIVLLLMPFFIKRFDASNLSDIKK